MPHHEHLLALLVLFVVSLIQGVDGASYCCGYYAGEDTYTGAMATVDVYSFPNLEKGQKTGVIIWISDINQMNRLTSGWEVNPDVYGDSKPHFYVYWTTDGGKHGCTYMKCGGFVLANFPTIRPWDILEPPNGHMNITLKIYKSVQDGNWWLYFGHDINNLGPVGYWSKGLLTNIQDGAAQVAWGGCAKSNNGMISPPLGNGQWPRSDSAASFRNVQLVDTNGRGYDPVADKLHTFQRQNCYQTGVFRFNEQGNMFYYGGPGGCTS